MEYTNTGSEAIQIPVARAGFPADWIMLKSGETKEVPENLAVYYPALKQVKVEVMESSIGETKVETKKKRGR